MYINVLPRNFIYLFFFFCSLMAGMDYRKTCLAGSSMWGAHLNAGCWEPPGAWWPSVSTNRQKARSWSTPAASRKPERKEAPEGVSAAVPRVCHTEKVAVMITLEARMRMWNNADLKCKPKRRSLKKTSGDKMQGYMETQDAHTHWNSMCKWSPDVKHRAREKYSCREGVVGAH